MVCMGLKPGVAGWKVQANPLCYGGTQENIFIETKCIKLKCFCPRLFQVSQLNHHSPF